MSSPYINKHLIRHVEFDFVTRRATFPSWGRLLVPAFISFQVEPVVVLR